MRNFHGHITNKVKAGLTAETHYCRTDFNVSVGENKRAMKTHTHFDLKTTDMRRNSLFWNIHRNTMYRGVENASCSCECFGLHSPNKQWRLDKMLIYSVDARVY